MNTYIYLFSASSSRMINSMKPGTLVTAFKKCLLLLPGT